MLETLRGLFTPKQKMPDAPVWVAPFQGARILPEWNITSAIDAYEKNPIVYACVRTIVTEIAGSNLRLFAVTKDGKQENPNHPAINLIRHPNQYQSGYELLEGIATWLELAGECAVYVNIPPGYDPAELFILDPRYLEVIPDAKNYVKGYIYRPPSLPEIPFDPDEIILFRDFNPKSQYRGHAPIRSARYVVDSDQYQEEWNRDFFLNDAVPRAALTTPNKLNDGVFERLKALWNETYKGRGRAHKTAILEQGVDVKILTPNAKDMDFVQMGEKNIQRICASFRVPKELLGIGLDANRAVIEGLIYIFSRFTIKPKLRSIHNKLNNELIPLFKKAGGLSHVYEFDDPVAVDAEQKNQRYQTLFVTGAISPNEIRKEENLPPLDGGDSPFVSAGLIPLDMAAENASYGMNDTIPEDTTEPTQDPAEQKAVGIKIEKRRLEGEPRELVRGVRDAKLKRYERRYIGRSRTLFETQKKQALAALDAYYVNKGIEVRAPKVDDIFNKQQNIILTTKLFEPLNLNTIKGGAQDTLDLLKDANDLDYGRARTAAKTMTMKFANEITTTTEEKLRKAISDGIEAGEGATKLADRVKTVFNDASTSRAVLIGRTESTKAYSSGSLDAMKQNNIGKKEWLTANDDDVRQSHSDCEGQGAIDLSMQFSNGLAFPGDPSGDPDEVCNCRCTLLPVVDDES